MTTGLGEQRLNACSVITSVENASIAPGLLGKPLKIYKCKSDLFV